MLKVSEKRGFEWWVFYMQPDGLYSGESPVLWHKLYKTGRHAPWFWITAITQEVKYWNINTIDSCRSSIRTQSANGDRLGHVANYCQCTTVLIPTKSKTNMGLTALCLTQNLSCKLYATVDTYVMVIQLSSLLGLKHTTAYLPLMQNYYSFV